MKLVALLLVMAGSIPALMAQTQASPGRREVSLQDCIQMALEHNLDIKIQRYNPQIARNTLNGVYAGFDPNFSVSGTHNFSLSGGGIDPNTKLANPASTSDANNFNSSLGGLLPWGLNYNLFGNIGESYGAIGTKPFDNTAGRVGIQLTQPLLKNFWIDTTRLNIAVAKIQLKGSEQQLRSQILDTVNSVEQAYYDLVAARTNAIVLRYALQVAEQQLADDKKRVEAGALAPLSETQDESQAASARATLIAAEQTVGTAENTLKQLLGDDYRKLHEVELKPSESLAAPVETFSVQESWRKALTERPDIIQAKLTLEQNGIQLKYTRNQLFPELDLTGSYGHLAGGAGVVEFNQGFGDFRQGNQPFYSYGAQMILPLGNRAARANYKSAKLTVQQSLLTLKKLEQTVMVTIDNDIGAARADFLKVESTHQVAVYAEAAWQAEKTKMDNGKSTNFEVNSLQSKWTSAQSDEIAALATLNKSLSQLAHDEASTFERRHIKLEIK